MMCKNPIVKKADVKRAHVITSEDARLLATPLPCGQCLHCRINQTRVWTHRILLEQRVSAESAFVTLTYDDENLPDDQCLVKSHLQNFLKKYRRHVEPTKTRYFAVGEYGEKTLRPHYHIALFSNAYICPTSIEQAWDKGFNMVGTITSDSARYITGYVVKKLTDRNNDKLHQRTPEFMTSSKQKGGIGLNAIKQIAKQLNENRFFNASVLNQINVGGKAAPLGRYLTKKLAEEIGITENQLKLHLWEYQEQIFDKHLKNDEQYYLNVYKEKEGERISQKAKHKIYRKRKSI